MGMCVLMQVEARHSAHILFQPDPNLGILQSQIAKTSVYDLMMELYLKLVGPWGRWRYPQLYMCHQFPLTWPRFNESELRKRFSMAFMNSQLPQIPHTTVQVGEVLCQLVRQFIQFSNTALINSVLENHISLTHRIPKPFGGGQHALRVHQQRWLAKSIVAHCELDQCIHILCMSTRPQAPGYMFIQL